MKDKQVQKVWALGVGVLALIVLVNTLGPVLSSLFVLVLAGASVLALVWAISVWRRP